MNVPQRRARYVAAVAVIALVGAACGGDDDGADATTEASLATTAASGTTAASATTAASEGAGVAEQAGSSLQVTAVDFEAGTATITNVGSEPYDLAGHWICNRPTYAELPAETLAPGASIDAGFNGFDPAGGEMAVYSSQDFGSSDALLAYVGWGAGGGRQGVAEQAGLWSGAPVVPAGDMITLTGDPTSASGWAG